MKQPLRLLFHQVVSILWATASVFMAWEVLCIVAGSNYPIMVVTSESMEPSFHRGDLIFLWNREKIIHTGDIPVIWIPGKPLPMVHRVVTVNHEVEMDGHLKYVC
jgi:signal peptidase